MNRIAIAIVSTLALFAAPGAASAAIYMKIEGVDGESTSRGHEDWIELESWSLGASQSGSMRAGAGAGAGRVSFAPLVVTKHTDKSSPILFQKCAQGAHFPNVTVSLTRTRGGREEEYLVVRLTDVLVSSFQSSGQGGNDLPTEQISFNYAQIEYRHPASGGSFSQGSVLVSPDAVEWDARRALVQ